MENDGRRLVKADTDEEATEGLEMIEASNNKMKKNVSPSINDQANSAHPSMVVTEIRQPARELLQEDDDKDEDERTSVSSESSGSIEMKQHISENGEQKPRKKHHGQTKQKARKGDSTTSSSSQSGGFSLGCIQLCAMVKKNLLTRCRSPLATFLEIMIPVLLTLLLVYQYNLAEVKDYPGTSYHDFHLPIEGPLIDLSLQAFTNMYSGSKTSDDNSGGEGERARRLLLETKDEQLFSFLHSHMPDSAPLWLQQLFRQELDEQQSTFFSRRHLQDHNNDEEEDFEEADSSLWFKEDKGKNDIWLSSSRAAKAMLTNPLPIPSLEQYFNASDLLSSSLSVDGLPVWLQHSNFFEKWGNLLTLGTLHLSPADSPAARQFEQYIDKKVKSSSLSNDGLKVQSHVDEAAAVRHIHNRSNDERLWALIDFSHWHDIADADNNDDGSSLQVKYKIRMNQTTLPNTDKIIDYFSVGLDQQYQKYYLSGYLTLQQTLNDFAFDYFNLTSTCDVAKENRNVWSMPMPTAHYAQNRFFVEFGKLLGTVMVLGFLFPVSILIKGLVEEKESRMRETLFILGVQPWAHWTSWLISALLPFLVIAVAVTSLLATRILKYSDSILLFMLIGLFLISTIGFCFCVAALFSSAKLSSIVGPMAFFATILPCFAFFGSNQDEEVVGKMWASLFPATAFAFGCNIVSEYEYSEQGVQSWNSGQGCYSFDACLAMLLFDSFFYMFLAWFLDQVMPREYGTPRPVWFLLSPYYWCGSLNDGSISHKWEKELPSYSDMEESSSNTDDHECMADPSLVPQIKIRNLTKRYDGTNNNKDIPPAVDQLDLDLYESQITTLLGHNGAGKTTAISLLTGLFPPTAGDASVYGNSIVDNTAQARRSIGICPQQNILFDRLTVLEHICFFTKIKGVRRFTMEQAKANAQEIGLGEFLFTTSAALSGGNKRKLCVAVALCGDPKFLILDEPSCGMDPCARRSVWELLRRKRLGRTILLSTHFMDEAELLSDRIAVLRTGNLLCSGSPLFLKNRHGLGYNFTAVLETLSLSSSPASVIEPPTDNLLPFIRRYVPGADIGRISGKEVTIRLPPGYEDVFPACFDELEKRRESLQIGAFGIQNASLEEVFIRLAQDGDDAKDPTVQGIDVNEGTNSGKANLNALKRSHEDNSADEVEQETLVRGDCEVEEEWENSPHLSPLRQILLLYRKRVTIQKRDPKGLIALLVVPVLVIALTLFVLTAHVNVPGQAIDLSLNLYKSTNTGGAAQTDVLVGGGNSTGQTKAEAAELIALKYKQLRHSVEEQYPHVQFHRAENNVSSSDLSKYLYHSINTHDHNTRYGAFVFNDTVEMKISSDWPQLFDVLNAFATNLDDDQPPWTIKFSLGELSSFVDLGTLSNPLKKNQNSALVSEKPVSAVDPGAVPAIHHKRPNSSMNPNKKPDSFKGSNKKPDPAMNPRKGTKTSKAKDSATDPSKVTDSAMNPTNETDSVMDPGPLARHLPKQEKQKDPGLLFGTSEKKKSNLDPGLLSGLLDKKKHKKKESKPVTDPGLLLGLLDGKPGTGMDSGLMSTLLLGTQPSSLMDPEELIKDKTMVTLTYYPSESIVNIMPELDLPLLNSLILGNRSFSWNMSLDDLREMAPDKKESYLVYMPTNVSILHNASSPHAVAAVNQAFSEFLFKQCTGKSSARLISENHPLPLSKQQTTEIKAWLSIVAVLFTLIPLCYIPGGFVVFLVKEKSCKSKHLQLVSGVNVTSYWIASYLYDITLYLVLTILVMIVFLLYGKDAAQVFVGDTTAFLCTLTLTFGYGVSVLPFSYLLARRFDNHSAAQIAVAALVFATGYLPYLMTFLGTARRGLAHSLRPLFRCWPPFLVGEGLAMMAKAFWAKGMLGNDITPFEWDFAGKPIVLLYALAIPYFALLLALEYSQDGGAGGIVRRILRSARDSWEIILLRFHGVKKDNGILTLNDGLVDDKDILDDDVLEEERRVKENREAFKQSAPIMYHNLWKVYPPSVGLIGSMMASLRQCFGRLCCCFLRFCRSGSSSADLEEQRRAFLPKRAVRGVSTVVEEGETYALLGANGAGKTSTLGVLTGDVSATSGQVYVAGHDATGTEERNGVTEARRHIGFCPQVDPLLDLMTARETLRMFGSLRGIPTNHIDGKIERLLEQLSLTPHADKPSQSLSGGNKRKLSLGIALIGDPKVLLIDESSSGMDPLAKRRMWNLIAKVSKNRTVIATTHSMEEAEALCTRAGIMAKGQLLCLGSVQHLKTKYLDGYTIDVFCQSGRTEEEIDSVVNEMIENALPGCRLSERYGRFLRFDVPSLSSLGLGTTFRRMQALKTSPLFCVENYSISQCSLEQVFVKLVAQVTNATGDQVAAPWSDVDDEEAPLLL